MQAAIQELQDAMVILGNIEPRRPAGIPTGRLAEIDEYRRRTERNLVEITEKLNRLLKRKQ